MEWAVQEGSVSITFEVSSRRGNVNLEIRNRPLKVYTRCVCMKVKVRNRGTEKIMKEENEV